MGGLNSSGVQRANRREDESLSVISMVFRGGIHLEGVECSVAVETEVVTAPVGCALELILQTEYEQRVERVDNGVSNSASGSQIRS